MTPIGTGVPRSAFLAAAALVLYLGLVFVDAGPKGTVHTGDTDNLVQGARAALDCIHVGTWQDCGHVEGTPQTSVFPYPLLQYLPAAVLVKLGVSDHHGVELLARLNTVAFVAALALCAYLFRRRPALALVAMITFAASALTFQSTSGFGEMLAATMILAAVVAAIERRPVAMVVLFFVASLGKETLPIFLVALGLLAAREPQAVLPRRRLLAALLGSVGAGAVTSLLFNVFRFGTWRNLNYLDPLLRTPGLTRKVEFFAAQWVSPAAGIAWTWPVATVLLGWFTVIGIRRLAAAPRVWRSWGPALAVVAVVVAFTVGLTAWFTPFGWITYGPRLAAPILPAAIVLGLHLEDRAFERGLRVLLRGVAAAVCVIGIVALVSWPQLVAPWSHTKAIEALIAPDAQCPRMTDYTIQQDPHFYFDCASHTMWRLHPSVLRATTTRGGGIGRVGAAVGLVFVVAGLVAARALLLAGRPADADEGPAREVDQVDHPSAGDDALSVARAAER